MNESGKCVKCDGLGFIVVSDDNGSQGGPLCDECTGTGTYLHRADAVPLPSPSDAVADSYEVLKVRLAEVEAISEGRRHELERLDHERRAEWTRAEQAEARLADVQAGAAAMRNALDECLAHEHGPVTYGNITRALSSDVGRGWVSPEEHARVQAGAAAMQSVLEHPYFCDYGVSPDDLVELVQAALVPDAGRPYLELREAVRRFKRSDTAIGTRKLSGPLWEAALADLFAACK